MNDADAGKDEYNPGEGMSLAPLAYYMTTLGHWAGFFWPMPAEQTSLFFWA
jgi:hypothetical protein